MIVQARGIVQIRKDNSEINETRPRGLICNEAGGQQPLCFFRLEFRNSFALESGVEKTNSLEIQEVHMYINGGNRESKSIG